MIPHIHHRRIAPPAGFSLVEIMVGMVIGLLGIIVIMQMYAVFEGQKRTTTSGDDAQNSGAIALYGVQRSIQHSGYGIGVLNVIGCNVTLPANATRGAVTLTAMAPVTINHANLAGIAHANPDANTDTLLVVYGNTNGSTEGDTIDTGTGTIYTMKYTTASLPGDMVIAEPKNLLDSLPRPACNLNLDRILSANTDTSKSPMVTTVTVENNTGNVQDGTLFNLGQSPKILAYAIHGGNLTVCDYMVDDCGAAANANNTKVWVPISSDIVSLRAEYGHDANVYTTAPTSYVVNNTYDQTTPTTNCNWVKTLAVRIALVARGGQYNKVDVTTTNPAWAGNTPIDLSGDANWKKYRYKVFETTVPLRNVTWIGGQSGC